MLDLKGTIAVLVLLILWALFWMKVLFSYRKFKETGEMNGIMVFIYYIVCYAKGFFDNINNQDRRK
jgi:hypothetical protein